MVLCFQKLQGAGRLTIKKRLAAAAVHFCRGDAAKSCQQPCGGQTAAQRAAGGRRCCAERLLLLLRQAALMRANVHLEAATNVQTRGEMFDGHVRTVTSC